MRVVMVLCVLFLLFLIRNCFKYPAKSKSARRVRTILIAGTLAVFLVCAFLEHAPRGKNSLFDKPGEGENYGSDDMQSYAGGGTPDQTPDLLYITVSQGAVAIGDKTFGRENGYEGCEAFLQERLSGIERVIVRDDYASSGAYHYVTELLEKRGIRYTEETVR